MDQAVNRPETETCAKWTLGGVLRTGTLLAAAAFASVLAVDLPLPAASRADGAQSAGRPGASQPFVPASDKWIELGAPQPPATPPMPRSKSERQRSAAVDPVASPGRAPEGRQLRRKPRGVPQGVQVAGGGRQAARSAVARRIPRAA